jgi:hypothetical protein
MIELEVKGIPKILERHGLTWDDLGIDGATIYYRRRVEDMPLMSAPEGADEARIKKVEAGRRRMLDKATDKYRFKVEQLCAPDSLIVEDGRLVGLVFRRTRIEDGRVKMTDDTFEARGPVIISSIGSIPEPIEGIEMNGELFDFQDWDIGKLEGYPTVFSVGNVVTGKGNIVASRKHASRVYETALASFLGVGEDGHVTEAALPVDGGRAAATAEAVGARLAHAEPPSAEAAAAIFARVAERQQQVGYEGDFRAWIAKHTPAEES